MFATYEVCFRCAAPVCTFPHRGDFRPLAWTDRASVNAGISDFMTYAYGLDRRRLGHDVAAFPLPARDLAAGAIKSPAQLNGMLDTRGNLRERANAPR
jgi:hypothetical protein